MFSDFHSLFDDARELMIDFHSVVVQFCYDTTAEDAVWYDMPATLERNASEADLYRQGQTAQLTRQKCHFLFERKHFKRDTNGQPIMPDENSAVMHDGFMWRASQGDRETIWSPEDHEGQVIRFRTTQQEPVE